MGSSGGVPTIGADKGFFPMGPQLGQESFQPWDMGPLGAMMGMKSFSGGPPARPQGVMDAIAPQASGQGYGPGRGTPMGGNSRSRGSSRGGGGFGY